MNIKKRFFIFLIFTMVSSLSAQDKKELDTNPIQDPLSYSLEDLVFLKPLREKNQIGISILNYGLFYYISRYPRLYGAFMTVDLLFAPVARDGGELYSYLPGMTYNFFLTDSDVGDDGRFEVFATNIVLMVGGRLVYNAFFEKNISKALQTKSVQITPVLSTNYQGLMATYRF